MNSSKINIEDSMQRIDISLLKRYYNNELTNAERNSLEKRALEDPFLKEAMDGFDENPDSFNQFYNKHKRNLIKKRSYTLLIGACALISLFFITSIFNTEGDRLTDTIASNDIVIADSITDELDETILEYEVIPMEIETLAFIPKTERISVEEVVNHQEQVTAIIKLQDEKPIEFDDDEPTENEYTIEDELTNSHKFGQESTSTSYLFDLLVVDYREISRENEKISYKRYELSGISADRENADEDSQNLVETEVQVSYFTYLRKSMSFFAENSHKKALNRYLLILEQYPNDLNALFYGGLTYYNLGKYDKSIAFFDKIMLSEISVFKEEALWYKAKSLIKQNKRTEAKSTLDHIIIQGGLYTKDAILLKESLK